MPISSVTLQSWSDIHSFVRTGWIYRGQESKDWPLRTSLERCCERLAIRPQRRNYIESELLREFRRTYYQYGQHVPAPESVIEWISLMQHHGAPTRLLDFTYSIYVAAYFAVENADSDSAVWGVRAAWALEESIKKFKDAGKTSGVGLRYPTREGHEQIAGELLFSEPYATTVIPLSPFRLPERLRTQRATFLAPGYIVWNFMENLLALKGHEDETNVIKIEIPSALRWEAIDKLFAMNISRTSLFPGLDGYSRSLGVFHPVFRDYDLPK